MDTATPEPPRRPRRRVFMTAGLTASATVIALQLGADQSASRGAVAGAPREDAAAAPAWAIPDDDPDAGTPEA